MIEEREMPGERDDELATLADTPSSKAASPDDVATAMDRPARADSGGLPDAAGSGDPLKQPIAVKLPPVMPIGLGTRSQHGSSLTLSTAADAMMNEEVQRTRLFILCGAVLSVAALFALPFVGAPRAMTIVMAVTMVWAVVMGGYFYRRFADPTRYTEGAMLALAGFSITNATIGILFFGVFSTAPVIIVVGIHFAARADSERAARWVFAFAVGCYLVTSSLVVSGVIADPGVFAGDAPLSPITLATGAAFVLAMYVLAYYTARQQRAASLHSIETLQRATRLASQRKALMDELRADLERALRVGGPGRNTDQIVGRFKLGMVLGRGAMGEVYEANHTETSELAAVKLLKRELLADPTHVARFLREAKASGALASPHVVRVIEAAADDVPYLAMERLRGVTLADLLRRDGALSPAATLELTRQVGLGVDAAASAGIVHRDLKPQNLFFTEPDSVWKILDFGVATLADDSGTLTAGGIVGTPSYMAPEQAQGKRVDARADVYAIAAVAYRCLTGRHPFSAPDTPALLYAVVHKMPVQPSELAALPEDVDRWAAIALAKSADDRFATGAELAAALDTALASALDPALRKRADQLVRKHGWGE